MRRTGTRLGTLGKTDRAIQRKRYAARAPPKLVLRSGLCSTEYGGPFPGFSHSRDTVRNGDVTPVLFPTGREWMVRAGNKQSRLVKPMDEASQSQAGGHVSRSSPDVIHAELKC